MTYPPQQQPDPWGQQQPPQEQWGQQDQWAQQPPPPPDNWGGGGGYDGYGEPPKKGGGKTVAIVIVIIVVLAGAGVGAYFWLKNKDDGNNAGPGGLNPNDPKSVAVAWADKYSKAYNSDYSEVKAADLKPLMCQSQYKGLDEQQKQADAERAQGSSSSAQPTSRHRTYKLDIGDVKVAGDSATVLVTATQTNQSGGGSSAAQPKVDTRMFDMKKENGGWKVCGPKDDSGNGSGPSGSATPSIPGGGTGGDGGNGGGGGIPAPSGSMKPLPSGIPVPSH